MKQRRGNFVAVPLAVHSLLVGQWKASDFSSALMYVDTLSNTILNDVHALDSVVYYK